MLILKAADGAFSLQTYILFEASHNQIVNIMFILFRSFAFVESSLYTFYKKISCIIQITREILNKIF